MRCHMRCLGRLNKKTPKISSRPQSCQPITSPSQESWTYFVDFTVIFFGVWKTCILKKTLNRLNVNVNHKMIFLRTILGTYMFYAFHKTYKNLVRQEYPTIPPIKVGTKCIACPPPTAPFFPDVGRFIVFTSAWHVMCYL